MAKKHTGMGPPSGLDKIEREALLAKLPLHPWKRVGLTVLVGSRHLYVPDAIRELDKRDHDPTTKHLLVALRAADEWFKQAGVE